MINRTAFKIAASTMIVALTMVGCTAQSEAMRRSGMVRADDSRSSREAAQHHEQARRALQQGQLAQALSSIESAVALSPRDVGYRMLLAEIYMKSGRFESARATYSDVVELDPSNSRAALSLALMQIALGRPQAAVGQLDQLHGRAGAADVGLAYALAGMPERAIEILEPAARAPGATARLRQNLALSYALAGDWQRARTIAAQDVSPADLGPRLQQWAAMARPDARSGQVAALLGVNPVQDPGQPVQLALSAPSAPAPEAAPEQAFAFAEAAPAPAYAAYEAPAPADSDWGQPAAPEAPDAAPVQMAEVSPPAVAEAESYYIPLTPAAPEPPAAPAEAPTEAEVQYALAAQSLTRPEPTVVRAAAVSLPPEPVFRRRDPRPAAVPAVRRGDSRFVVQLGSFAVEANAERAWVEAEQRFALGEHQPLTTTIEHNGRTMHRVSVAGFAGFADAQRLCNSVRSRGGVCFVRSEAGDASVRWAARYARDRSGNA